MNEEQLYKDLCSLSVIFNRNASRYMDYGQETRINDWLKEQLVKASRGNETTIRDAYDKLSEALNKDKKND